MGFHICITNEKVVKTSIDKGVYGNVGNPTENRGTIWGKIKDLYAVKPGDLILLYEKNPRSQFHGVFEVTSKPYICFDNLFKDDEESYPFRFNFRKKLHFPNCVPSFEFYSLIETGKIDSLISLSRDVNSSYRGIRQLFDSEFQEIIHLFYKYNPKTNPNEFPSKRTRNLRTSKIEAIDFDPEDLYSYNIPTEILFNKIPSNRGKAILEDVIHAYIVYNVLYEKNNVRKKLGLENFNELILEAPVFKSMQFRSDILATFKHNDRIYYYSFFELKKDKKIGIDEISQLIGYLKSFAASKFLPVNSYEGVYISTDFTPELIDYLTKRKTVEKENIISLIQYETNDHGEVFLEKII
ncbi:EVE domain-containing protein [Algoriphagus formosus]|uniref:EVE domain-containing protein n=1 Tax=Algoriphagus formosus TaxID=2007308 RepID=UPI000C289B62|nr:EVE domain-containing protein [Algoriphagus formosus]